MLAIQTYFLGPTNTKGSRIVACVMENKNIRKLTISCADARSVDENHKDAARQLIRKLGWTEDNGYGQWVGGSYDRGYVFVCDTKHGVDRLEV